MEAGIDGERGEHRTAWIGFRTTALTPPANPHRPKTMSVPDIAQRARATEHKIGVLTCDVARDKVRKPASSQRVFSNRSDPFLERKEDGRCQDAEREGGRQTLVPQYPR